MNNLIIFLIYCLCLIGVMVSGKVYVEARQNFTVSIKQSIQDPCGFPNWTEEIKVSKAINSNRVRVVFQCSGGKDSVVRFVEIGSGR